MVANDVYRSFGSDMVVTAIGNGRHMVNSLHGKGLAADLRIKYGPQKGGLPPDKWEMITAVIQSRLPNFDVILETDHIHLEYDPK